MPVGASLGQPLLGSISIFQGAIETGRGSREDDAGERLESRSQEDEKEKWKVSSNLLEGG